MFTIASLGVIKHLLASTLLVTITVSLELIIGAGLPQGHDLSLQSQDPQLRLLKVFIKTLDLALHTTLNLTVEKNL